MIPKLNREKSRHTNITLENSLKTTAEISLFDNNVFDPDFPFFERPFL